MGWANCGEDGQGRPIGYAHNATCDHPACEVKIDRGLAYACGGEHGEGEWCCEGYFCEAHLSTADLPELATDSVEHSLRICDSCRERITSHFLEFPEDFGVRFVRIDGAQSPVEDDEK